MASKKEIYSVQMNRFTYTHSYFIGTFSTKTKAINAAEKEYEERGGKYGYFIYKSLIDSTDKNIVIKKESNFS